MSTSLAHDKYLTRLLQALFVTLPFISLSVNVTRYGIQISFLVALLLIVVVALRRCVSPNLKPAESWDWVSFFVVAFWIASLISVIMTLNIGIVEIAGEFRWVRSIKTLVSLGLATSLFIAIRVGCRSPETMRSCIATHLVIGTAVALFGHYEWVSSAFGLDLPLERYHGYNPSIINEPALLRESHGSVLGLPRVGSVLVEPGFFGSYLVTVLPFFVTGATYRQYWFTRSRAVFLFCGGVVTVAILLTLSRAPYLGLVAMLLTLICLASRKGARRLWGGVLLLLLINGGVFWLLSTMGQTEFWEEAARRFMFTQGSEYDLSYAQRMSLLETSLEILKEYPLFGVGMGNFGFYYGAHAPIEQHELLNKIGIQTYTFQFPASIYGQIIAETGIAGTLAFFGIMVIAIVTGLQTYLTSRREISQATALGLVASLIGFMTCMIAFTGFHTIPFLWPILGLIVAQSRLPSVNLPRRGAQPSGRLVRV